MRSVNVRFLRPGQVVADVIKNSSGAVMCPIGYTLTDKAIERLKTANVSSVWIEGNPDSGPNVEQLETRLNARFAGIDDPTLLRIKGLLKKRFDLIREEYGG